MIRRTVRSLGVVLVLALLVGVAVPAGATGSHSKNKSFSTCAYTIEHWNQSGAVASTVGNSNCYWATVRLQYRFGGDTLWTSTKKWYQAVWAWGPSTSTTLKSRHQIQHYPSYQWSSTCTLY